MMKKIKVIINYDELQALDMMLSKSIPVLVSRDYSDKCVSVVLLEWLLKKVKPALYFKFTGTKRMSIPVSVCCALMALNKTLKLDDVYQVIVWNRLVMAIDPLL
jgi:hypothetical protein